MTGRRRLVFGVGNPDRGDDGIGPEVARRIRDLGLPGVEVTVSVQPVDLPLAFRGAELAVVLDASRSRRGRSRQSRRVPPGTVQLLDAKSGEVGEVGEVEACASTHGIGLAEAVRIAHGLGTLPDRLLVVTVEAASFTAGDAPSVSEAALTEAVRVVVLALGADVGADVPQPNGAASSASTALN